MDVGAFFQSVGGYVDQAAPVIEQGLDIAKKIKLLKKKKGKSVPLEEVAPPQVIYQREPAPSLLSNPLVLVGAAGIVLYLVLRRRA